jgi:hypothetical protein
MINNSTTASIERHPCARGEIDAGRDRQTLPARECPAGLEPLSTPLGELTTPANCTDRA